MRRSLVMRSGSVVGSILLVGACYSGLDSTEVGTYGFEGESAGEGNTGDGDGDPGDGDNGDGDGDNGDGDGDTGDGDGDGDPGDGDGDTGNPGSPYDDASAHCV